MREETLCRRMNPGPSCTQHSLAEWQSRSQAGRAPRGKETGAGLCHSTDGQPLTGTSPGPALGRPRTTSLSSLPCPWDRDTPLTEGDWGPRGQAIGPPDPRVSSGTITDHLSKWTERQCGGLAMPDAPWGLRPRLGWERRHIWGPFLPEPLPASLAGPQVSLPASGRCTAPSPEAPMSAPGTPTIQMWGY